MCLLVQQPATVAFTEAFLLDVYSKNQDGLGIMYADQGELHVYKCLPANAQDFADFYRKHGANKACIWHARMRTHGDIDNDNCHPYQVTDDIWLAHNGILSTGNVADPTKSDTWHFIRNVLRPTLTTEPDLMLDPAWQLFIGELIGGGNKFGLMRSDGKSAIINRKSGVEFMQSWVSNTYAWSPHKFGMSSQPSRVYSYYGDNEYSYANWQGSLLDKRDSKPKGNLLLELEDDSKVSYRPSEQTARKYIRAAYNQWSRRGLAGVEQWVYDAPDKAANVLLYWYEDCEGIEELVYKDPDEAATWIEDLFRTESVTPSWLA